MRSANIFTRLLAVDGMAVEDAGFDQDARGPLLVIDVRPYAQAAGRCSRCGGACPGYDQGGGLRRWRHTDFGSTRCYLQAAAPRVHCREHRVVVAAVPWARAGAKHTHAFEDTCAWLAAHTAFTVLTMMLRVAWRTVADIMKPQAVQFYDFLVEEGVRESNPVGRGRYTPGRGFGAAGSRPLVPRVATLPWILGEAEWLRLLEEFRL